MQPSYQTHMSAREYVTDLAQKASRASKLVARASTAQKNQALVAIIKHIEMAVEKILVANAKDLDLGMKAGMDTAMLDRLKLDENSLTQIIASIRAVVDLPDPVGVVENLHYRPSGIQLGKMSEPLGVIGIIYESRPNVTVDAAVLCLKSGNAVILRGGSEAYHSNMAFVALMREALTEIDIPLDAIQ